MNSSVFQTDSDALATILSRIGTGCQLLAVSILLLGGIVAVDGVYPVLPTSYTTIIAASALVFAASSHFEVKALEARLEARS